MFTNDLEHGGRIYLSGNGWTNLSGDERKTMRVWRRGCYERQKVVEYDVLALDIWMLYAQLGIDYWALYGRDPYLRSSAAELMERGWEMKRSGHYASIALIRC